ncbi:hypothetical protein HC928_03505 [bacterium]|nr:hypothetical protein [bacterium]
MPQNVELTEGASIVNQQLQLQTAEGQYGSVTIYHAAELTDYVLEAEIFVVRGNVSLWVREQTDNISCGYVLTLFPRDHMAELGYTSSRDQCRQVNILGESDNIVNRQGEWMTVRLEARGNNVRGYIDDTNFVWANVQTYRSGTSTTIQADPQSEIYINSIRITDLRRNANPSAAGNVPAPPNSNPLTPNTNNNNITAPFSTVPLPAPETVPPGPAPAGTGTQAGGGAAPLPPAQVAPLTEAGAETAASTCSFMGFNIATYSGPSTTFGETARVNGQQMVNEQARDATGAVWLHITNGTWVPAAQVVTNGDCTTLPDVTGQ